MCYYVFTLSAYLVGECAKVVGVSVRTLQRWDREGVLIADRTVTNRRVYTEQHRSQRREQVFAPERRKAVVYCRVSSAAQKPHLANQRQILEQFCAARGLAVKELSPIAQGRTGA